MGLLHEGCPEDELLKKIKILVDVANAKFANSNQNNNGNTPMPLDFTDFVRYLDVEDKLTRRMFEVLVKEIAIKKAEEERKDEEMTDGTTTNNNSNSASFSPFLGAFHVITTTSDGVTALMSPISVTGAHLILPSFLSAALQSSNNNHNNHNNNNNNSNSNDSNSSSNNNNSATLTIRRR